MYPEKILFPGIFFDALRVSGRGGDSSSFCETLPTSLFTGGGIFSQEDFAGLWFLPLKPSKLVAFTPLIRILSHLTQFLLPVFKSKAMAQDLHLAEPPLQLCCPFSPRWRHGKQRGLSCPNSAPHLCSPHDLTTTITRLD